MAYFFQGDTLLVPADTDDLRLCSEVPLEWAADYDTADVFEIPAPDNPLSVIQVISFPPDESGKPGKPGKPGNSSLHENCKAVPVRQILALAAGGQIDCGDSKRNSLLRACHISQWRRDSRFCGTCGAENCDPAAEEPIQLPATPFPLPPPSMPPSQPLPPPHRICPKCGRIEFPRICPAVIVLITDDQDRILLAHNKKFKAGLYSHISGFNEAGESLEETAAREIREEVNIEVKDITYVKSQPWPFPDSLMVGFRARYASGAIKPDGDEIEDAKWFTRDNLPELPRAGSLSRWLIDEWLAKTDFR